MDINRTKIGVVGGGSWGTALANLLAGRGFKIDFWVFEEEVKTQIETERENRVFLAGCPLSENLFPSNDLKTVVADKEMVLVVVPSHLMRGVTATMSPFLSADTIVVSASKGIENKTHLTMSGVLAETLPQIPETQFAVLSGPSFAREVVRQVPTVVTVASKNRAVSTWVQEIFATPFFRVYTGEDVIGLELGGSVKNVIAIAAGIIDGLGLGLNTRAALITRGLVEMRRLGLRLGANPRTFTGSAGLGDLVLTCTGDLSRNHTVGRKIGEGMTLEQILGEMRMVAEGVKTAKSVYNLSRKLGTEMPISHEIYHILYDNVSPKEALHRLMTRDLKDELDEE
ncbi:NAD(P)-dependent glycerol-3-phosphate dehydrogen ase [Desulfonema ishimotonii]|uniref:Glycerol-3-phosphate dehydrogenase [NAD(P)+] n=1 Tax=Desulfonema ishimotonii TaxID=45657 RepID=A0A401G462_9BACT|nr:NAD(P)-dependent glycerol-3-phosphate dehydrogen ase [Desulfonema ishimotonii]